LRLLAPPPSNDLGKFPGGFSAKLGDEICADLPASGLHCRPGERKQALAPLERAVYNLIRRSQFVHKTTGRGFGR
jgi:hypothetical protein